MIVELPHSESGANAAVEPRIGRSISLDRAAELLGVSRRTIYNWIRENRLQTVRTLGGSQRVLLESVLQAGVAPSAAFSTEVPR